MRILAELDDESFSRLEEKLGMHVRDILKFIVLNNGIIELHVHKKDKAAKEMCKRFKKRSDFKSGTYRRRLYEGRIYRKIH